MDAFILATDLLSNLQVKEDVEVGAIKGLILAKYLDQDLHRIHAVHHPNNRAITY